MGLYPYVGKMATNAEKFLILYREYETLLRDAGLDYKDLEEKADDFMQNRLRINRQLRNYLTHNHDAGFLDISDKQIAFMENLVFEQKSSMDILKKHLKTPKSAACLYTDNLEDVITKMSKLHTEKLPVYDDSGVFGLVCVYDVMKAFLSEKRPKTAKLSVVKKLDKKISCMAPDTLMPAVSSSGCDLICCTDTGNKNGKLLGVFFS